MPKSKRFMTANACTTCRGKRTRCDGKLPCQRCTARKEECKYEERGWQTKEYLRSEVKRLRRESDVTDAALKIILTPDQQALFEKLRSSGPVDSNSQSPEISQHGIASTQLTEPSRPAVKDESPAVEAWPSRYLPLSTAPTPQGAKRPRPTSTPQQRSPNTPGADWYESSESPPGASDPSSVNTLSRTGSFSQTFDRHGSITSSISSSSPDSYTSEGGKTPPWTNVTYDLRLRNRLVDLFFTLELVPFSLVTKSLFWGDYAAGRRGFCSPALVNAIMSLSSRHLSDDEANQLGGLIALGELFSQESRSLLDAEPPASSLPDIQALGLLAMREIYCGRHVDAESLLVRALECIEAMDLSHANPDDEENDYSAVRTATLSSVLSIARMVRIVADQVPLLLENSVQGSEQHHPFIVQPDAMALRMRKAIKALGTKFQKLPASPSFGNSAFELTDLVYPLLEQLHENEGFRISEFPRMCQYFFDWYNSFCQSLKNKGTPTPCDLFTQIYFYFCSLILVRPFIHLPHQEIDPTGSTPRTIYTDASKAILSLTRTYANLFTLRRASCLIPHFVFAAGAAQIMLEPWNATESSGIPVPSTTELLELAIRQLAEVGAEHPCATQAECILRKMQVAV